MGVAQVTAVTNTLDFRQKLALEKTARRMQLLCARCHALRQGNLQDAWLAASDVPADVRAHCCPTAHEWMRRQRRRRTTLTGKGM